ncbi:hypothetical protein LTR17_006203 [Elasticomyces elasticus]|nr:hypothetical protein LTR17_006203 [Elasticomyces elasticus]
MAGLITTFNKLNAILPDSGVTGKMKDKSVFELRTIYNKATRKGASVVKEGSFTYSVDKLEVWLAQSEAVLGEVLNNPTTLRSNGAEWCADEIVRFLAQKSPSRRAKTIKTKAATGVKRKSNLPAPCPTVRADAILSAKRQKRNDVSPRDSTAPENMSAKPSIAQTSSQAKKNRDRTATQESTTSGQYGGEEDGMQSTPQKYMRAMVEDDPARDDSDINALETDDNHGHGQDHQSGAHRSEDRRPPLRASTTFTNEQPNYITNLQESSIKGNNYSKSQPCKANYPTALTKGKPRYLWRVHSNGKPGHKILPAAWVRGKKCYASIYDFPTLSELVLNLGDRALSYHKEGDQFSSYTTSLLFALVHAQALTRRGEQGITITFIDTWAAKNSAGEPADFYHLPALQKIIGTAEWKGWTPREASTFKSPQFSHEYVAHGVIDLRRNSFQPVPFGHFVSTGLYDHIPGFLDDKSPQEMLKLYHRCLQLRVLSYHSANPRRFGRTYLDRALALARLSCPASLSAAASNVSAYETSQVKPVNLRIFLDVVGLTNREKNDRRFIAYIKQHFKGNDVERIRHDNMNHIPNNLPELLQVMDRIRETCNAFNIPEPAANLIDPTDKTKFEADGRWKGNWDDITGPAKSNSRMPKEQRADSPRIHDVAQRAPQQQSYEASPVLQTPKTQTPVTVPDCMVLGCSDPIYCQVGCNGCKDLWRKERTIDLCDDGSAPS